MLKRKRIISMVLTLVVVSTCSSGAYYNTVKALEETKQVKMSPMLLEKMEKVSTNEKVPMYIELGNIDLDIVESKVDKQTGMSMEELETLESNLLDSEELQNASGDEIDSLLPEYFSKTKKDRKYVQGLVNQRIAAKRKISKQMYQENNEKRIKELGINKNELEFVSSYSPIIVGEMTEDEVEEIIVSSNVVNIDYCADIQVTTDLANSVSTTANTPSAQDLYANIWKSAVNVDYTINTLDLKGQGVNVGLFDRNSVIKSHNSELSNTNITNLDEEYYYAEDHGEFCTRVLAGSNGVVSKANVYTSNFRKGEQRAVENLIDHGVTVISFSVNFSYYQNDYYGPLEKWFDYICYNSGIVAVFAAGNISGNGENILQGAAAYNVITVGGINTNQTFDKSKHTFWTDTSTVNNGDLGCAKPDVEAPATNVLGVGGTSAAAPIVAGICAQIIETKPTLAYQPDAVKAILLASCDRKCLESYTEGLTEKEGSGVVNAQRAIKIVSSTRYARVPSTVGGIQFILGNSSDYCKCALAWLAPATTVNNIELPNYKFELNERYSNNYIGTNVPNSSAEILVTNAFKANIGYNYMHYNFTRVNSITSKFMLTVAWYDF